MRETGTIAGENLDNADPRDASGVAVDCVATVDVTFPAVGFTALFKLSDPARTVGCKATAAEQPKTPRIVVKRLENFDIFILLVCKKNPSLKFNLAKKKIFTQAFF